MKGMTLFRAAQICGGRLMGGEQGDTELGRVVIDSRTVEPGDIFAAFKGENTDGHDYIEAAIRKGAGCCLAQRLPEGVTGPVLLVPDVQQALEKLCAVYRESLSLPIIGVTGSVGKTSVKEMISAVLSQRLRVLKTEGNLNNQLGVPMTLSRIEPEHQAAVVEMGISGFGEMSALARMARPNIAVYTVIGHAHLEFLGDADGVFRAKTEMLEHMAPDGTVIVNGDDERLNKLRCAQRVIRYGLGEDCLVRAENISLSHDCRTLCDIVYGGRRLRAEIPAFGRHMVYAALAGAAVGFEMGLEDHEIERGIKAFENAGHRGQVIRTGGITLLDDSYNANPDSMRSSIDSLMTLPGRHVCILSDMLEMGGDSEKMHYEVGLYALEQGADAVLCCGPLSRETARGAGTRGLYFESREALTAALPELLRRGDTVLVKASRGMHMEKVSEALKGMGELQ